MCFVKAVGLKPQKKCFWFKRSWAMDYQQRSDRGAFSLIFSNPLNTRLNSEWGYSGDDQGDKGNLNV
jgi:hypothetical protein